jgi:hypothetical protein
MTIETAVYFDNGDAISEWIWKDDKLIGCMWADGESEGWQYRATNALAGYWSSEIAHFETMEAVLASLCTPNWRI